MVGDIDTDSIRMTYLLFQKLQGRDLGYRVEMGKCMHACMQYTLLPARRLYKFRDSKREYNSFEARGDILGLDF